ncbi:MAG TPA: Gfo/Idh/MocA family oxidoreductase [Solirubrobacteraceae bacterium]|nr:Gfo/Idh/MocA family oxidoreductase [Solirubrobacteraceae bacterium]
MASAAGRPALGVGMVGYSFMGRAHSQAWRTAPRAFDLPLAPRLVAVAGRSAENVEAARAQLGFEEGVTDWRALLERDDVGLVDICTPGDSHAEIAVAALDAGKHVLCEKPLATSVDEGELMVAAAERAAPSGVKAMVGFNYRRVPALAFARQLIADGRLGAIRHVRAVYLQDWIVDPEFPLVWRLQAEHAGSGALGDIGAHIIDAAQFLLGDEIAAVSGLTETFVKERPLAGASAGLSAAGAAERGPVTVDDAALFLARFPGGAIGTFEATRFATGRKNGLAIEVNGALGSLRFDLERLSELELYDARDEATVQGFRRILITAAEHPYMEAWWPPGHLIGWEHSFTHEVRDLVVAIADGTEVRPTFADGLQVERVLAAVSRSAARGAWEDVT